MTDAEFCRSHGLGPGSVVEIQVGWKTKRAKITAIGKKHVFAEECKTESNQWPIGESILWRFAQHNPVIIHRESDPLGQLEAAMIRRSRYSDCHPDWLYRLTLPTGGHSWHPTYEAARQRLWEVVESSETASV